MITEILPILVMINPIGLFLYLSPVRKELSRKNFIRVLINATGISFFVLLLFVFFGNFLFETVFQISFEAFRIFGGIVIFSFSYFFIVKGKKGFIHVKENLDDLASEIALPFMVGSGTISLTILLAKEIGQLEGSLVLAIALVSSFIVIFVLELIHSNIPSKRLKIAFDKNMEILLRLNGFFIGAIGVNMILTGILNTFF